MKNSIGNSIALEMNKIANSPNHVKLFKKASTCCGLGCKCDESCPCNKKCEPNCVKCAELKSEANLSDIINNLISLSAQLDNNNLTKSAILTLSLIDKMANEDQNDISTFDVLHHPGKSDFVDLSQKEIKPMEEELTELESSPGYDELEEILKDPELAKLLNETRKEKMIEEGLEHYEPALPVKLHAVPDVIEHDEFAKINEDLECLDCGDIHFLDEEDEKEEKPLPKFVDGGYPLVYFNESEGSMFCAECAAKEISDGKKIDSDIYWEGPELNCEECGASLESVYGDPDSNKSDDEDVMNRFKREDIDSDLVGYDDNYYDNYHDWADYSDNMFPGLEILKDENDIKDEEADKLEQEIIKLIEETSKKKVHPHKSVKGPEESLSFPVKYMGDEQLWSDKGDADFPLPAEDFDFDDLWQLKQQLLLKVKHYLKQNQEPPTELEQKLISVEKLMKKMKSSEDFVGHSFED